MQNTTTASSERLRVLVLDDYERLADQVPAFAQLKARAEVTVMNTRLATNDELGRALQGIHAILLMRERSSFKEDRLSLAPSLKLISQTGKTSRHLDLPAATRRGVAVAFTPSDSGISTVELTWGLILSLMRRIPEVDRRMRQEAWPPVVGHLIEGKTIGVIGLGRIGKEVTRIARAFKARVLATGRTLTEERAREAGAEAVSLETLLRESDIVTIHVPSNPQTRGLIGEKEIALMKRGAILINTARGPIVSQGALFEALQKGHLGGAGLDVYDEEPLPMDHPLRRLDNAVLLSHRGYATEEILRKRYQEAMENILNFFDGKPVQLHNPEVLSQTKR